MGVNIQWLLTGEGEMLTKTENMQQSENKIIGERLQLFRKSFKLNRLAMCKELDLKSEHVLEYIEKGLIEIQSDHLKKLEILFDINIGWLLNGNGDMSKTTPDQKNAKRVNPAHSRRKALTT